MIGVVAGNFGVATSVRVRRELGGGGGGVLGDGGGVPGAGGGTERGCLRITGSGGVRGREITGDGVDGGVAERGGGGGTAICAVDGPGTCAAISSVDGPGTCAAISSVGATVIWSLDTAGAGAGGNGAVICAVGAVGGGVTPRGGVVVDTVRGRTVVDPPRGGLVVETVRGGEVVDKPRGGVVVETPRGGVVVETVRGGTVVDTPRGGVVVETVRGGTVVETPLGGVLAPSGETILVIGDPGLACACGSFIPGGMPRIVGTFTGASCAPRGGMVTRPVWRAVWLPLGST